MGGDRNIQVQGSMVWLSHDPKIGAPLLFELTLHFDRIPCLNG